MAKHGMCHDARLRERQRAAALERLLLLEASLRDEIDRLRRKGKGNAALIHFMYADRLEEILGDSKGGGER